MGFQPVPDTALFIAHFSGPDGVTPSFGLYAKNTAAPWDAAQLALKADQLGDALVASYIPALSEDFTLVNITSRDLEQEFGLVIEGPAINEPGTLASPSLPAGVAVKATFKGSPGDPPRTGGIFLLPPAESQVVGNLLTGGALTALQDAAEAINVAMETNAPNHVIVSRYQGTELVGPDSLGRIKRVPVKRAEGVTSIVTSVNVKPRVDSQRKRRPTE